MNHFFTQHLLPILCLSLCGLYYACGSDKSPNNDSSDLKCAHGTKQENGTCVLLCLENEYFDGAACQAIPDAISCAQGTELQDGSCVATLNCGPGTHLVNDECVPNTLSEPDVLENDDPFPEFVLPVPGEQISLGGIINLPFDQDNNGTVDPDWDGFFFQTTETNIYLRISATSAGACRPGFRIRYITPETCDLAPEFWKTSYERYGVNSNGLGAEREIYLPYAGCYFIEVSDYNNIMEEIFTALSYPLGGPDFSYHISIENLGEPTLDTIENFPTNLTGDFSTGKLKFYELSSITPGMVLLASSAGEPLEDKKSYAFPALMAFNVNGQYTGGQTVFDPRKPCEMAFLIENGAHILVQDFWLTIGPNDEYDLSVSTHTPTDCNALNCSNLNLSTDELGVLSYDVLQHEIFYFSAGATTGFFDVRSFEQGGSLRVQIQGNYVRDISFVFYAPQDMKVIVILRENDGDAISFHTDQMLVPESLIFSGVNTGKTVTQFPFEFYPSGIDQFDAEAGRLVVVNNYEFSTTPAMVYPYLSDSRLRTLNMRLSAGGYTWPSMFISTYPGRYIHWVHAQDDPNFYPNTYSVALGFINIAASAGTPTASSPIEIATPPLDADVDIAALRFGTVKSTPIGIRVEPANSNIRLRFFVLCRFRHHPLYGTRYCYPQGNEWMAIMVETTETPGQTLELSSFLAAYTGEYILVVQDLASSVTGTETMQVTFFQP